MYRDMTRGGITRSLLLFALPMMAGSLLQQLYNVADTLIVGRALGRDALAAVGSAFTLMTFLTSVFLGAGHGRRGTVLHLSGPEADMASLHRAAALALCLIGGVTAAVTALVYVLLDPILRFLQVPDSLYGDMAGYLRIIFVGLAATFLYNFFACLLRSAGNSAAPLWFLGGAALLNVGLDLLFVLVLRWGVSGAAAATVIAQYAAGLGLTIYAPAALPPHAAAAGGLPVRPAYPAGADGSVAADLRAAVGHELRHPADTASGGQLRAGGDGGLCRRREDRRFAYLPVQEFGNAFSTFSAQNYGAGQSDRLRQGLRRPRR